MKRILTPTELAALLADRPAARQLVVVDIRTADEYQASHIPSAISIPFEIPLSAWITMRDELLLELPEVEALCALVGGAGIRRDHHVVVVSATGMPPYPQAGATRVAETLAYVGVEHVSILDGGFPAWDLEGRETSTEVSTATPAEYQAVVDSGPFVDTEYVHRQIGHSLIVDARDPQVYAGSVVEPWADKPGHIPTAVSLPASPIWQLDGTYRGRAELAAMATAVLGGPEVDQEIILYCGVGGYASSWLFLLTRVLGYRNVKMYDGSAQEWVRYHDMEI